MFDSKMLSYETDRRKTNVPLGEIRDQRKKKKKNNRVGRGNSDTG